MSLAEAPSGHELVGWGTLFNSMQILFPFASPEDTDCHSSVSADPGKTCSLGQTTHGQGSRRPSEHPWHQHLPPVMLYGHTLGDVGSKQACIQPHSARVTEQSGVTWEACVDRGGPYIMA